MVGARLAVPLGENRMPLAEFEVSAILQLIELPFNEGVVEGIRICGDEGTSPIGEDTELLQIQFPLRWEKLGPILSILEFRDLFIRDLK
jgi:hypothetical protein